MRSPPSPSASPRSLDIDDGFVAPAVGRTLNAYTAFRSPTLRRITRPLPGRMRSAIGRINRRSDGCPPMGDEVRADLETRFEQDNAALARWLGRDLSEWGAQVSHRQRKQGALSA